MIEDGLRVLTECISRKAFLEPASGFLGGDFGYGIDYENDIFMMSPYYWGDCTCGFDESDNFKWEHKPDCYQTELRRELGTARDDMSWDEARAIEDSIYQKLTQKYGLTMWGCAVHCTCGSQDMYSKYLKDIGYPNGHREDCLLAKHNFIYKPTGATVDWYKYIGRDMRVTGVLPPCWFEICMASIKPVAGADKDKPRPATGEQINLNCPAGREGMMEKIDRKFIILATNPCKKGSVHTDADAFLFLAEDRFAVAALDGYIRAMKKCADVEDAQILSAMLLRNRVVSWQIANGMKNPDVAEGCEMDACLKPNS